MLDSNIAGTDAGIEEQMAEMGRRAREASRIMATVGADSKNRALTAMADAIRSNRAELLEANAQDMEAGRKSDLNAAFLDRLALDESRIEAIAEGLESIAGLDDPVGSIMTAWDRPNGLHIERVRTPLGVIGVIFESRPNVTADAGGLCLKAGNAAILRGGSDSSRSSGAIHACLVAGLEKAGLPREAIQLVSTTDRAAVGAMLSGLGGTIDVIVPRGGKGLVGRVQAEARVPVFAHLEGICHVYVDQSADIGMARRIVVNSKMRRTGICGAAETLLIDRACAESHVVPILGDLAQAGCEIRADEEIRTLYPAAEAAQESDWGKEFLAPVIAVRLVDGVDGAIEHITRFGSSHTESIVAEDDAAVSAFFSRIDSAILLHNASTQFADGGEFGMGAEIGIATGKMHARGPVGVEQLTSFNYRVRGNGQIRP